MAVSLGLRLGLSGGRAKNSGANDAGAQPILCGRCHSTLRLKANLNPQDMITCTCGNRDTLEKIQHTATQFLKEHAARTLRKPRGNKIGAKGESIIRRGHRFYVEVDG